MTWFPKTRYLPLKAFFCREFRNLKPLRPTESSPTRLAVTKVWHLKWLTVLHYYWSAVVSQHPSIKAYFWIMCNIAWLNISCRRPPWELPGPWPRVTKRSTGGFTGSTSHFDFGPSKFKTSIWRAVYEGAQGTDCSIRFASPGRFSPVGV